MNGLPDNSADDLHAVTDLSYHSRTLAFASNSIDQNKIT